MEDNSKRVTREALSNPLLSVSTNATSLECPLWYSHMVCILNIHNIICVYTRVRSHESSMQISAWKRANALDINILLIAEEKNCAMHSPPDSPRCLWHLRDLTMIDGILRLKRITILYNREKISVCVCVCAAAIHTHNKEFSVSFSVSLCRQLKIRGSLSQSVAAREQNLIKPRGF